MGGWVGGEGGGGGGARISSWFNRLMLKVNSASIF